MSTQPFGPYERDSETREAPLHMEVRRLHREAARTGQSGTAVGVDVRAAVLRHLAETCAAAGVELGAYDRVVLEWLSGAAGTVAVQAIIGIISRAHAAGRDRARWMPPPPPWQRPPDEAEADAAFLRADHSNQYE